jgi:sporulation protein YlmC with PRC-barrel domain
MMRLKHTVRILAPALGLSLAVPVFAQTSGTAASPRAADRNAPAATTGQHAARTDMRASKLIGKNLENAQGQNVGEIKDLIVDVNGGRAHYAIVSFGGAMGVGDKLFAYPVTQLKPGRTDRDKLTLDVDKARLKDAPGFDKDRWPDWNVAETRTQWDKFHGPGATSTSTPGPNARMVRMSKVLDADLKSAEGSKDIGDVDDVVVDLRTGQVRYAVVEFERGFLKGDKLVALPMQAFTAMRDDDDLIVKVDRDKLANAPAFERSKWPENDRAFDTNMDRYNRDMGWGPSAGRPDDMNRATTGTSRGVGTSSPESGRTTGRTPQ